MGIMLSKLFFVFLASAMRGGNAFNPGLTGNLVWKRTGLAFKMDAFQTTWWKSPHENEKITSSGFKYAFSDLVYD